MDINHKLEQLRRDGFAVIENVLGDADIESMSQAFNRLIDDYESHFDVARINENERGTLRCIISLDEAFLKLAQVQEVSLVAHEILDDYIFYSFNGFYTSSAFKHPTTLFHRDVPLFTNEVWLSLNLLYCIDDTTTENGATWFVPGSHLLRERPSEAYIDNHKVQVTAKRGSVILFNSLTFHASGINHSGGQRRCVANVLRRSFMKPQFQWDIVLKECGFDIKLDLPTQKLFGLFNNPAKSLDDYYAEGIRRREERRLKGVKTIHGIEIKDT
jgi:ectoine hydroxylase-related dioxygenase (phytanoyl-CoA dioxygenase family)